MKELAIEFAEWLKCIDNGANFYNPATKEKSPSIGFSPYDCFVDDVKTVKELFKLYLANKR